MKKRKEYYLILLKGSDLLNNISSIVQERKCLGCGACISSCPKSLIKMSTDEAGFFVARITSETQCIQCGACLNRCATNINNKMENNYKAFYGYMNDEKEIQYSTSGGLFASMAKSFLAEGGIVFGAALDLNNKEIKHIKVDCEEELYSILKSKYVQSNSVCSYYEVLNYLENNKKVLFCGTPCQIYGLKKYLNKQYSNLYTVDFICHGVPSKKLFFEYIDTLSLKYGNVISYDFRAKDNGWQKQTIKINNKKKRVLLDEYNLMFLRDISLNPGCLNCPFRKKHYSDLILADFWGYKSVIKNINIRNGISLILSATRKGDILLKQAQEFSSIMPMEFKFAEYAFSEIKDANNKRIKSINFYNDYIENGYKYIKNKYASRIELKYVEAICKNYLKALKVFK